MQFEQFQSAPMWYKPVDACKARHLALEVGARSHHSYLHKLKQERYVHKLEQVRYAAVAKNADLQVLSKM
jgi:hypothetical protein